MPLVTVKQKYQVTIPAKIRALIDIEEGDTLEAVAEEGRIVLTPKALVDKGWEFKKPSLLSLKGSNQGSGLYDSADDVDKCLADQRSEWK